MRKMSAAALLSLIALLPLHAMAADPAPVKAGDLVIETPWLRATPGGAAVGGGYVKIRNTGKVSDRLVGGSAPIASAIEVHEMAMMGDVMQMRRIEGLEIKPGATVELKPGGYHLMLTELKGALKAGDTIKATLVFEKAGKVDVEFAVAPVGATAPQGKKAPAGHSHH